LDGNLESEFIELGATTSSALYVRGRINIGGRVNDITCTAGDKAFAATENSSREFQMIDVSDPDNISVYSYLNLSANGKGIDFANNYLFEALNNSNALQIITSN
jgi:hypothetical protein